MFNNNTNYLFKDYLGWVSLNTAEIKARHFSVSLRNLLSFHLFQYSLVEKERESYKTFFLSVDVSEILLKSLSDIPITVIFSKSILISLPCALSIYKHMHCMSPWRKQPNSIDWFLYFHVDSFLHMMISKIMLWPLSYNKNLQRPNIVYQVIKNTHTKKKTSLIETLL